MRKEIATYFGEHQGAILQYVLGTICVLFIGILILVYLLAKQANPVFLDENGKPVQTQGEPHSH